MISYNLSIRLYYLFISLASYFNPKAKKWIEGRKNWKQNLLNKIHVNEKYIWVHCASVGEFEQGRPLIETVRNKYPHYKILLTFFSPSGYELRKNYQEANYVFYLPLDTRINANEFISIVKPHLAIFVKYEFWLNYINECKINDIPLVLISARFSKNQIFFKKYGKLFLKALESFKLIFVQDEESKKLIESVKYSIVNIANDTRFDRVAQIANNAQEIPLIDQFIGNYKNVLICGSTWEADEIILASLYSNYKTGSLKIIIAPHEINTNNLNRLQNLFPKAIKYSQIKTSNPESEVLIIDNIGMLSSLYKYASICYIGGGFGKGVHNTLEAAVYGKPVLFGPNYTKFNEANDLIKLKAAFCVSDKSSLIKIVESLLNNKSLYINSSSSSKNYVYSKTGGTEFILTKMIEENLL